MLGRQRQGSVVCPTCGRLVGVRDERCLICGTRNPSLWGFSQALRRLGDDLGFTKLLIFGCGALFLVSIFLSGGPQMGGGLFNLLSPRLDVLRLLGASGPIPIFVDGRWWTPLSATLLHGGLVHILFNMMWLRDLAPAVARFYGAGRMVIVWTVAGVTGFALSAVAGVVIPSLPFYGRRAGFAVGASAAIFGLLGALIWYGRRTGQKAMSKVVWGWAAAGFLIGLLPGIDNFAHLGGFVGGWVAARLLDPLRDERPGHVLTAIVCLVATVAAVVASVVTGLTVSGE